MWKGRSFDSPPPLAAARLPAIAMIAIGCGGGGDTCPAGSVAMADGSCKPADCPAGSVAAADGSCQPAECPAGSVEVADRSCVEAGIRGCAAVFIEEDGFCRPSMSKCPGGTIPKFDEGCVPVGIPSCADAFLEDGLCRPSMKKCGPGTFAVPQKGCVPIDGPDGCGSGPWGHIADGPDTVYVDPSAPSSGDGEKASPVKTIAEALAMVPVGGRVALAAGTYDEPIHITQALTVEGRCPSMVRVQGTTTTPEAPAVVWVDAAEGVTLRGLELSGAGAGIVAIDAHGLMVDRVHVSGADRFGVLIEGAMSDGVSLGNLWVEGTVSADTTFITPAFGVYVQLGARVALDSVAIVENDDYGLLVSGDGTDVTLNDSLVEDTLLGYVESNGWGVTVDYGAHLTLLSSAVRASRQDSINALDEGTELVATGNLVEGPLPAQAYKTGARGLVIAYEARATLTSNAILGHSSMGIGFGSTLPDSTVTLTATGNLVAGTIQPKAGDPLPLGIVVNTGGSPGASTALASNAVIENQGIGLWLVGEATVTGNLVEGTLARDFDEWFGDGVWITGGHVTFAGNAVAGNRGTGIMINKGSSASPIPEVTATDNLVADTLPRKSDQTEGFGITCSIGAHLELSSSVLRNNRVSALLVEKATATLSGCLVDGVLPGSFTLKSTMKTLHDVGDGLVATRDATLDVTNARVQGCARAGLLFNDSAGTLSGVVSTNNRFGLAIDGDTVPSYEDGGNLFTGNTDQDTSINGDLPTPDAPKPDL